MMHRDIISLTRSGRYREDGQVDPQHSDLQDMLNSDEPSLGRILIGIAAAFLCGLLGAIILL